jgi:hypothetical protein
VVAQRQRRRDMALIAAFFLACDLLNGSAPADAACCPVF